MAGSRKWFAYTTDLGDDYALELDESNTEAVNGGTQDFLNDGTIVYALPRNLTPRKAYYSNAEQSRTISCVCLTEAIYDGVPQNARTIPDPLNPNQNLSLVRVRPERIRLPFGVDTGLTDGDAT